jgi:uncharacterized membrane protein YhaH (DUF805 family)
MGFVAAVKQGFRRGLDFKGRATRPEYWWFTLFAAICNMIGNVINGVSGSPIISFIILIPIMIPNLAVAFRRLHDTDHSGWWYSAIFILLIAGSLLMMLLKGLGILVMLAAVAALFANLIFFCTAGTNEANRFGPPPQNAVAAPAPE